MSKGKKFIARWLLIFLVGVGIGGLVPVASYYWPQWSASLKSLADKPVAQVSAKYHFRIDSGGVCSVVEGKPGEYGPVVLSGINAKDWPATVRSSAAQLQFNSLDEVQSFLDSVSEPLLPGGNGVKNLP